MSEQISVPCSLWRGGTSRALFFQEHHLPPPGPLREHWLRLALGSHDPLQIDGLGGAQVNTSKLAIVSPPSHPLADIDYLAGLAAPGRPEINYDNNCGNILAAVAPYALDRGLIQASGERARIAIFNRNEKALIHAEMELTPEGQARLAGDFTMPGIPGTGAPIFLDYSQAMGAGVLPTGLPREDMQGMSVSLVRGAALCLLVQAADLGISAQETPAELNANLSFLEKVKALHQTAGERVGLVQAGQPNTTASPFVLCVAGETPELRVRVVGLGRCHPALAATAALTLGVACQIPGTLLAPAQTDCLRLHHPTGVMEVFTRLASLEPLRFERLGYLRTARKLMEGNLYLPLASLSMA